MNRLGTVLFLLLLVGALSLGGWAWQWMHGPEYTLVHAAQAIETHDVAKFRTYVDVPLLANSLTNQTIRENTQALFEEVPPALGALGRGLASKVADAAKPMMRSEAENTILQGVEEGYLQAPSHMSTFWGGVTTFVLRRNPEFQVKQVTTQNDQSQIQAIVSPSKLKPTDAPKRMTFLLRKSEAVWRLIGCQVQPVG